METTGRQQPYVLSGYVQAGLESEKGSALPVSLDLTKKRLAMQRLRREENLGVCLECSESAAGVVGATGLEPVTPAV